MDWSVIPGGFQASAESLFWRDVQSASRLFKLHIPFLARTVRRCHSCLFGSWASGLLGAATSGGGTEQNRVSSFLQAGGSEAHRKVRPCCFRARRWCGPSVYLPMSVTPSGVCRSGVITNSVSAEGLGAGERSPVTGGKRDPLPRPGFVSRSGRACGRVSHLSQPLTERTGTATPASFERQQQKRGSPVVALFIVRVRQVYFERISCRQRCHFHSSFRSVCPRPRPSRKHGCPIVQIHKGKTGVFFSVVRWSTSCQEVSAGCRRVAVSKIRVEPWPARYLLCKDALSVALYAGKSSVCLIS